MVAIEKILEKIVSGKSDTNVPFDDLRKILLRMGFVERTKGSHHIFRKDGVEEKINLQKDSSKAKPYQVKQARSIILKYRLWREL